MALDKSRSFSELNLGVQQFLLLRCSGGAAGKMGESLRWIQCYCHASTLLFLSLMLFRNSCSYTSCQTDTKNKCPFAKRGLAVALNKM